MIDQEIDRAAVMLPAVDGVVQAMRDAGIADPVEVIKEILRLPDLDAAVFTPLLVQADPLLLTWAPNVRALLIVFTTDDQVFIRRVIERVLDVCL